MRKEFSKINPKKSGILLISNEIMYLQRKIAMYMDHIHTYLVLSKINMKLLVKSTLKHQKYLSFRCQAFPLVRIFVFIYQKNIILQNKFD